MQQFKTIGYERCKMVYNDTTYELCIGTVKCLDTGELKYSGLIYKLTPLGAIEGKALFGTKADTKSDCIRQVFAAYNKIVAAV